jgi:Sensors of blue-light using FAD
MTETAGDSGPVFRLIYRSRSRVGAAERKRQLGEIFSVARSSNKKRGVTGALLITDDEFVQTLEGPEPVLRELYAKISKDKRHEHLELLESGDVSGRVFGRWAMAKVAAEGEPDIPLLANIDKGVSARRSPGPPPRRRKPSSTSCASRCGTPGFPPLTNASPPPRRRRPRQRGFVGPHQTPAQWLHSLRLTGLGAV